MQRLTAQLLLILIAKAVEGGGIRIADVKIALNREIKETTMLTVITNRINKLMPHVDSTVTKSHLTGIPIIEDLTGCFIHDIKKWRQCKEFAQLKKRQKDDKVEVDFVD